MAISPLTKSLSVRANGDRTLGGLGLLLAGILMGLWPAWPLAWVSLVPLWWVVHRGDGLRRSAWAGLIWGVGYHGTLLAWVLHLHPLTWLGVPWLGSIAIAIAAYAFVTLWGAALAVCWAMAMVGLQRWAPIGNTIDPMGRVLVGMALWCGLEALWSCGPLYGTSLAITQSPGNLVIVHLARLSGHLTITAAIVVVNGFLALAIDSQPRRWLTMAVGVFAIAHLVGWGLYQQPLQDSSDNAINIGIIQGNIPSREKLTYRGVRRAEDVYRNNYRLLAQQGADAVLTPEGALPKLWSPETSLFNDVVQEAGVPLWLGTFTVVPGEQRHIYQSLVEITPRGTTPDNNPVNTQSNNQNNNQYNSQYNKIKLVPLGEYIPLQSLLGELISRLSPIGTDMLPGLPDQRFETAVGPAAVGICYDSAYGWIFRRQVAQGGEFILTASNNDPYPRRMMAQHYGHDVIQAIATDRWAARSTNTGLSAVVDPHGHRHWMSEPQTFDAQLKTIYRRQTRTLYVRWGDWLVPGLLLVSGVWVWRLRWLNGLN
ncbi:apolipoprotein N-acyltransferase [Leptothoe sp. PORK10 BA2]|uniref:apolipoprotein N-acyltransferase n=1 Tax=Leptothoe sp. PORK10 BA2 TaxID=3110254 RepID=UPI002B20BF81|nr:apolipoprotein N-acyltransferase [Leptothoe sp. PORK10 BA2]MEA5465208.1 apolipoprotein N-acyltransferase [Leptothoe sp. PORK10 BA2]